MKHDDRSGAEGRAGRTDAGVPYQPVDGAEKVAKTAQLIRLRDELGKARLAEGRYTSGRIDARWTEEIERDFSRWLEELLKERTW